MTEKYYLVSVDEVYRFSNEYDEMLGRPSKEEKISLRKDFSFSNQKKLKSEYLIIVEKEGLFYEVASNFVFTMLRNYNLGQGMFILDESKLREVTKEECHNIIRDNKYFEYEEIKNIIFKFLVFAQENKRLKKTITNNIKLH
jgi:hypothetical protein